MARDSKQRLEGRTGEIWKLYTRGMTQHAIAERFEISQSNVSRIIAEVRASIPKETRDEVVQSHIEQLRRINVTVAEAAEDGDPAAIAALIKVQEREAKLLGLDSAIKQEVDATVRYEIAGVDDGDV